MLGLDIKEHPAIQFLKNLWSILFRKGKQMFFFCLCRWNAWMFTNIQMQMWKSMDFQNSVAPKDSRRQSPNLLPAWMYGAREVLLIYQTKERVRFQAQQYTALNRINIQQAKYVVGGWEWNAQGGLADWYSVATRKKESGWEVLKGKLRNVKHYKNFFGQRLSQIGQHPD